MVENICVDQYGCHGNCCRDTRFNITADESLVFFGQFKPIKCSTTNLHSKANEAIYSGQNKVFYTYKQNDIMTIIIAGPCPNLNVC